MKVLVTGANGFVGKNLCLSLSGMAGVEVLKYDVDNAPADLDAWAAEADFVFHLAGVNRPKDPADFTSGNAVFTENLLAKLAAAKRRTPVLLSSSIQAALDNPYGKSKRAAEEAVRRYGAETGAAVYVLRLANVFGKWCRPNYNSVVATWCHNVARDLPIEIRDPDAEVSLIYIDDVVAAFCWLLIHEPTRIGTNQGIREDRCGFVVNGKEYLSVTPSYTKTLGEIAKTLEDFRLEPMTLMVPDQEDGFTKKLYSTYLSYLPEDKFCYPLTTHGDNRGSFTEILHTAERGQVSVNISRPGIAKGQHWHHTKHEKFCVVSGKGRIQFRKMDSTTEGTGKRGRVIEYLVSGDKMEVVRVPPGYTHNIENLGDTDMVTVMWANEVFDPARPDTFHEEV